MNLLRTLDGSKSYAAAALLVLCAALDVAGVIPAAAREALYAACVAALGAALRHALAKLPAETTAKAARIRQLLEMLDNDLPQPDVPPQPLKVFPPALLLLAVFACGETALADSEYEIKGPTSVSVAGISIDLYLQGEIDPLADIGWDVLPQMRGLTKPKPSADGRSCEIVRPGGHWNVIVSVNEPGKKPRFLYYDISIPGQQYVPPPGPTPLPPTPGPSPTPPAPGPQPPSPNPPGPAPAPEPSFPAGKFGMAEATYRLAKGLPKAEAACLAGKLRALVKDIQDKKIVGAQAVVNAIGAALDACTSAAWDDARAKFTDRVAALFGEGRLRSLEDDWKPLIEEALLGLEAVAR